ncbi:MAG: hypothetical protein HQK75_10090 [Candidatus Magnetomorum sp.]|nr:hypothetical protein [Candidatus Magnetomorum sp.]
MFEKEINTFKNVLASETNFSKIWDYFMTNLGENPAFLRHGKKAKHPMVKKLLSIAGKKMFAGQEFKITNLMLQKVKNTKMVHGPFFINNKIGLVVYCDDINMGLIAISSGHDRAEFYRITSQMLNKDDINNSSLPEGVTFIPKTPKTMQ